MNNYTQSVLDAMQSNGFNLKNININGKLIRFNTHETKKTDKSGWYIFDFQDGVLFGAFGCFRTGISQKFTSKNYKELSPQDKKNITDKIKQQQSIHAEIVKQQNEFVSSKALELLSKNSDSETHEYIEHKKIKLSANVKIFKNNLLIPLFDINGKIWTFQRIYKNKDGKFEKRYYKPTEDSSGRKQGCFYPMYGKDDIVLLCEGYSTGVSLHIATGQTVICAMDAGNLPIIASELLKDKKYAESRIIICADNDFSDNLQEKSQIEKRIQSFKDTGCEVITAPRGINSGYDFNDFYCDGGDVAGYIFPQVTQAIETLPPVRPFDVIGSDNDKIYFLVYACNRIFDMTTSEMTEKNLYRLAPKSYWDRNYAYEVGKRPDMLQACDDIIQEAYNKPFFDYERIRGRGVWRENDNIIVNTGDSFFENGKTEILQNYKSKNFYIAGKPFDLQSKTPSDILANQRIRDIFEAINLKNGDLDRDLLFGWCVASQISGILKWRPHLWVSGSSGSGKSDIQNSIVAPLLGSRAIYPEAGTTEAGIRQALASDSLSVIYEEAEANSQSKAQKIEAILELARTSSSSSKRGTIYKGSAGGAVTNFKVRSCFYFTAIQPSLQNKADISRVSVIEVVKDNNKMRYAELCRRRQFLTDDVCDSFFLWIIKNAQVILKNIDLFCPITASLYGGNSRNGDQIGTLLACAWTAVNNKIADRIEAEKYLQGFASNFLDNAESQKDDSELLQDFIMQQLIDYETNTTRKKQTIGTLLAVAGNHYDGTELFNRDDVVNCLSKYGIYAKDDFYGVNNHQQIRKWLRDSPWAGGFIETLKRNNNCLSKKMEQIMVNRDRIYVLKFFYRGKNK
jgi:putative DNA primase/helicase